MSDLNIDMAALRKSRRTRRMRRKSRGRSRRQRGGAVITLNCTLDAANKVQATPPEGVTLDNSVPMTLTVTPAAAVNDIAFAGPGGAVNPRYLGLGTGIIIEQGTNQLVPKTFTGVRNVGTIATKKKLNSTAPASGAMKIKNLNTSNLGLTAANRSFTITVTTV